MLSRLSLDNHLATRQNILTTLTSDLNGALSLCLYPSDRVNDLINIAYWFGSLSRLASPSVTSTASPLCSAFNDVILPYLHSNPSFLRRLLFSSFDSSGRHHTLQALVQLAQLVNYLVFLQKGDFRRLSDRLLDVTYSNDVPSPSSDVIEKAPLPELPDYYFLYEKHLIRSLTSVLHTVLPLVWRSWVYRRVTRLRKTPQSGLCGECGKPVVNLVWTGCGHLHCHYCLGKFCGVCDAKIVPEALCYP